jgi:hypothetical protein
MFTDPQSVTISGTANSLPRTNNGVRSGEFSSADNNIVFSVAHTVGKRSRRTARIQHRKVAPDPLFPAQNTPYSMSFYIVADVPNTGYTVAEQKAVIDGFLANLQATSGANLTKLLGGEN